MNDCPDLAAWETLAAGSADPSTAEQLRTHLKACCECRIVHQRVEQNERLVGPLRAALRDASSHREPAIALVGRQIGRYRVNGILGSGGMATVYEAMQEQPRRIVALKVINQGLTSPSAMRRFEHEVEILGRLQHPNIAQIHDASAHKFESGAMLPYFAMELVRGLRLTDYAEQNELGTRQRLQLFVKVCLAVQYAHQRGVVHRDLKPSNILVDERGEPKVLDFGVARAIDADIHSTTVRTDVGQLVGTLAYMSPEQSAGDSRQLDTRSDVYALGVVCYELLTGRLPYEVRRKSISEAVRVIREDDPAPLSSVDRVFRRDLEAIVSKSLEKHPDRRYASVAALAEDIERYVSGRPVLARTPSIFYQLRKMMIRHKAFFAAVAAVFLAVVIGLIGTTYGLWQANIERKSAREALRLAEARRHEAEQRRAASEAVTRMLEQMLRSANPHEVKGHGYTVRQLLDDFSRNFNAQLGDQPEVEAAIRATVGNAYRLLGAYGDAERHLRRALDLRLGKFGDESPLTLRSRVDLAWLLHDQADYASAAAEFRTVLAALQHQVSEDQADVAMALNGLSDVLRHQGRITEAESPAREALAMRQKMFGEAHTDVAESMVTLGKLLREKGDFAGAGPPIRRAIDIWGQSYGREHPLIADALNELAWLAFLERDYPRAASLCDEAIDMGRKLLGDSHPDLANSLYELAMVKRSTRRFDESEKLLREALEIYHRAHGETHPSVATTLDALGQVLQAQGQLNAAEPLLRDALEMRRELYGPNHPEVAASLNNLAVLLKVRGDLAGAEPLYREALELRRNLLGSEHPDVAGSMTNLAYLLKAKGDLAGAEGLFCQALAAIEKSFGTESPAYANCLSNLAFVVQTRDASEAETLLARALTILRTRLGERHADTLWAAVNLARCYNKQHKFDQAESLLTTTIDIARAEKSGWSLGVLLTCYGVSLRGLERQAPAQCALDEAIEVLNASLGVAHEDTRAAVRELADLHDQASRGDRTEAPRRAPS